MDQATRFRCGCGVDHVRRGVSNVTQTVVFDGGFGVGTAEIVRGPRTNGVPSAGLTPNCLEQNRDS